MSKLVNGLAQKTEKFLVYNYNFDGELLGSSFIQIEEGTGLPAQSTLVEPLPLKEGFTQVFNKEKSEWEYVEDHRYDDVYDKGTGQKVDISYIGKLLPNHTLVAPPSDFGGYKFDDKTQKWVEIEFKEPELTEEEKKILRLENVQNKITTLVFEIQEHLLMDEKEEAKNKVLEKRQLEKEVKELEEEIKKLESE